MFDNVDDQVFALLNENNSGMVWFCIVDGTVYGSYPSRTRAYGIMKDQQKRSYPRSEQHEPANT